MWEENFRFGCAFGTSQLEQVRRTFLKRAYFQSFQWLLIERSLKKFNVPSKMGVQNAPLCANKWKEFLQCRDYQRNQNRNGRSSWMPKRADVPTMTSAENVRTIASKVSGQWLWVALNTTLKGALNTHQTATILMLRDRLRNYTLSKFQSLTERKIAELRTFFIQKNKVCDLQNASKTNREVRPYKYINKYIFSYLPIRKLY